jgi:6-phosphogluconolactonase
MILEQIAIRACGSRAAEALAARLAAAGAEACALRGRFLLAASPALFRGAAGDAIATTAGAAFWRHTHVFWTDTACDAPGRDEARAGLARLPIPAFNLHLDVLDQPHAVRAAAAYEQALRAFFALPAGALPRFDLALVSIDAGGRSAGLGATGPALDELSRLAVAEFLPCAGRSVVTLTPPVLAAARRVVAVADSPSVEAVRARLHPAAAPRGDAHRRDPLRWLRTASAPVEILVGAD